MSIINDALIKAEKEKMLKEQRDTLNAEQKFQSKELKTKMIMGLVVVFGVSMWILGIINIFAPNRDLSHVSQDKNEARTQKVSSIQKPNLRTKRKNTLSAASINVEGILFDEHSPLALINNELIKEGDEISGHKVVKIGRKDVIFEKEDKRFVVGINK